MNCPDCKNTLRKYARFCFYCGLEVIQYCPLCAERELRPLHTLAPEFTQWCGTRGEALHACVHCGRWFASDTLLCPNPQCRGEVKSAFPPLIGQEADGNHALPLERCQGDTNLLVQLLPQSWTPTPAGNWFTLLAYGKRYHWTQQGFFEASDQKTRVNVPFAATLTPSERCTPDRRVAVLGSQAILATQHAFLRVGLSSNLQWELWDIWGAPLTQATNGRHWLGWTERAGERILLHCKSTKGALFEPARIELPPEAALRERGKVMFNAQFAYWIGLHNQLWSLELESGRLESMNPGGSEIVAIRSDEAGVYVMLRDTQNASLKLSISPVQTNSEPDLVPVGSTDFVDWGASPRVSMVLSTQNARVITRSEYEEFYSISVPNGRIIEWALWDTGQGDPSLVTLSVAGSETRLRRTNLRSGVISPFTEASDGSDVVLKAVTKPRLASFANQLLIFSPEGIQRLPLR